MSLLQFEIKDLDGTIVFVRVQDIFEHHYAKETMRKLRMDYMNGDEACSDYLIVNESVFEDILKLRVNADD